MRINKSSKQLRCDGWVYFYDGEFTVSDYKEVENMYLRELEDRAG